MTRASLIPFAWVLGGLLVAVLCVATAVSLRLLRAVRRDFPDLHAELGRPGAFYFLILGWLTPSRFGIWLLTRPPSMQALPAPMQHDAGLLRLLLLLAFGLWGTGVVLVVTSWFL